MEPSTRQSDAENMNNQGPYREGIRSAYFKTITKAKSADAPDIIQHTDVKLNWTSYREHLLRYLENPEPRPEFVELIEKPKNDIAVRPIARFDIRDRLTYETLVYSIADAIDGHVSMNVFSSPWKRPGLDFRNPVNSWLTMHKQGYRMLRKHANSQLARTDIVSFYENVDTGTLRTDLDTVHADPRIANQICAFLDGFQQRGQAWGLPQGCDASGILANLYLLPIDELVEQQGVGYLRYSDDMLLIDESWEALRSALLEINRGLRGRRMSMSSTKTKIYDRDGSIEQLDNTIKDAISYGLRASLPGTLEALYELIVSATEGDIVNDRDIKFSFAGSAIEVIPGQ
ncbi:RNA-directed DNA polymerase [Streptacidiphilus sp. 4-A2]|nr:RNA-directed DNA polymerase [Streptacidiphilus sp. 4-A2]